MNKNQNTNPTDACEFIESWRQNDSNDVVELKNGIVIAIELEGVFVFENMTDYDVEGGGNLNGIEFPVGFRLPAVRTSSYIVRIDGNNTGGHVMVDTIELTNGMMVGVTDETVVLYKSAKKWREECPDETDEIGYIDISDMGDDDDEQGGWAETFATFRECWPQPLATHINAVDVEPHIGLTKITAHNSRILAVTSDRIGLYSTKNPELEPDGEYWSFEFLNDLPTLTSLGVDSYVKRIDVYRNDDGDAVADMVQFNGTDVVMFVTASGYEIHKSFSDWRRGESLIASHSRY